MGESNKANSAMMIAGRLKVGFDDMFISFGGSLMKLIYNPESNLFTATNFPKGSLVTKPSNIQ